MHFIKLFVNARIMQTSFFTDFAQGSLLQCFATFDVAFRNTPAPLEIFD
jgi:hypothetical protein